MLQIPTPPRQALTYRSDDLDEVRAAIGRADGEHSRVVHGRGPLGYARAATPGSKATLYWGSCRLGQTVRGELRDPIIHISVDSISRYRIGAREQRIAPGGAIFLAPGVEFTRDSGPGDIFGVSLSVRALMAEAQARRPDSRGDWAMRPHELDPEGPARDALDAAVADLAVALHPDADARWRHQCEAQLISVLVDVLLVESAFTLTPALTARRVADLETWIDAYLDEPITLGRLCEVAQVGARALQLAFQARRGMSPMRFVTERRLAAAHRRLSRAGPEAEVTAIATSVGFSHLGRFAAMYRQAYGETPSQTLRGG
jgi:AraC-like DNA-binding protein